MILLVVNDDRFANHKSRNKTKGHTVSTKLVTRPGITAATLKANGIEHLDSMAELSEYGFKDPGTVIPYFIYPDRKNIIDNGYIYARERYDVPKGDKKYHQNYETTVHAYIPFGLEVEELVMGEH